MAEKKTVLVTGSKGFIGSHLVKALTDKKMRVMTFDIKESQGSDITSPHAIEYHIAASKPDVVFHLAALKSVPFSFLEPFKVMETNAIGTLRLLEACLKHKVKQVIYSSSSSVYGGSERGYHSVESQNPNPLSPYAISKLTGEHYCNMFSQVHGLPTTILRYFNVYGPGCESSQYLSVIPIFIRAIMEGKPCQIYGSGEQARDFTYVSDIVKANIQAMEKKVAGTHNVACGKAITITELVNKLGTVMKKRPKKKYLPERKGEVFFSQAAPSKFKCDVSLEEGLRRMIKAMRE